jgi:hypothetical protein
MGVYNSLPIGLQQIVRKIHEDLDDQEENFVNFESGFDSNIGMVDS